MDYARALRHAFDSQQRGRLRSAVSCRAPQRCAPATQFRQSFARRPFRLNIHHKHGNGQTEAVVGMLDDRELCIEARGI